MLLERYLLRARGVLGELEVDEGSVREGFEEFGSYERALAMKTLGTRTLRV